jgi:hypothetical protein
MKRFKESPIAKALDQMSSDSDSFYNSLDVENRLFVKQTISHLPTEIQRILIKRYKTFNKPFNANTYLRNTVNKIDDLLPEKLVSYFSAGEDELRELADNNSQRCKRFECYSLENSDTRNVTGSNPVNGNLTLYDLSAELVNGFGITPPEVSKSVTLTGAL